MATNFQASMNSVHDAFKRVQEENKRLKALNAESSREIKKLKTSVAQLTSQNEQLNSHVTQLTSRNEQLNSLNNLLERNICGLRPSASQQEAYESEAKQLKSTIGELEDKRKASDAEMRKLKSKLTKLNNKLNTTVARKVFDDVVASKQQLEIDYKQISTRCGEHTRENEELSGKSEELSRQNAELQTEIDRLSKQSDELFAKSDELSAKGDELSAKGDELSAQNGELSTKIDELSAQKGELSVQNGELSTKIDELSAQNGELSAKGDELWTKNVDLSTKNVDLSTKIDELSAKNGELSAKIDELSAQNGELSKKNKEQWVKNENLIRKNHHLEARNQDLEARNERPERKKRAVAKGRELDLPGAGQTDELAGNEKAIDSKQVSQLSKCTNCDRLEVKVRELMDESVQLLTDRANEQLQHVKEFQIRVSKCLAIGCEADSERESEIRRFREAQSKVEQLENFSLDRDERPKRSNSVPKQSATSSPVESQLSIGSISSTSVGYELAATSSNSTEVVWNAANGTSFPKFIPINQKAGLKRILEPEEDMNLSEDTPVEELMQRSEGILNKINKRIKNDP